MKQSGMAMIEAVVAAGLLAFGLLGASRMTLRALDAALQTRHHEEAGALARQAMDCALVTADNCPVSTTHTRQGVTYTLETRQIPLGPGLSEILVLVEWRGSSGPQRLTWRTRTSSLPVWLGVSSP